MLGRLASDDSLYQYRGRADGGLSAGQPVGAGWKQHDMIVGVGDFDGDDHADLLARQAATGDLWLYRGNGDGGFLSKVKIGAGWQKMSLLVGPGDFDGDGDADLLAREGVNGVLWLYPGRGDGALRPTSTLAAVGQARMP